MSSQIAMLLEIDLNGDFVGLPISDKLDSIHGSLSFLCVHWRFAIRVQWLGVAAKYGPHALVVGSIVKLDENAARA